ncbi:MAG: pyruvate formate lyase family protein [Comamonadaceae bacterium]|nr:pyruvate formate lyase family protein [Comamonadaceae bacterium]
MVHSLKGLEAYAATTWHPRRRLQAQKRQLIPIRARELLHMAEGAAHVSPAMPAETLDEAVQSVWTTWIGMHMENTNAGLSPGRLDQWLQPYYLADLEKIRLMTEERKGLHSTRHRADRLPLPEDIRPHAALAGHRQHPLRHVPAQPGHHPGRQSRPRVKTA